MIKIGEFIRQLRKSKNLTQQDLGNLVGCSREYISQIETNKCKFPDDFILPFSKYLSHDINNLLKNSDKYKTFQHYIICHKLIDLIEKKDDDNIAILLKHEIVINEFDYGYPEVLKLYCSALVETILNKDIETSTKICLQQLGLTSLSEIPNFKPEHDKYDRYYSTIIVLGANLQFGYKVELHKKLLSNTTMFFEENIFNEFLPSSTISYFFKKFYIILLNNYSDTLFVMKEYENAHVVCEKAISFAITNQILYMIDFLLELKLEILYNLGNLDEAKETYLQFKYICQLLNKNDYFYNSTNTFKNAYPNLFN